MDVGKGGVDVVGGVELVVIEFVIVEGGEEGLEVVFGEFVVVVVGEGGELFGVECECGDDGCGNLVGGGELVCVVEFGGVIELVVYEVGV